MFSDISTEIALGPLRVESFLRLFEASDITFHLPFLHLLNTNTVCHGHRFMRAPCLTGLPFAASAPSVGYGPPPGITFDRFVRACVVVKTLTEAFQRYILTNILPHLLKTNTIRFSADTDRDGWVQLNYEQFMSVRNLYHGLGDILLIDAIASRSSSVRHDQCNIHCYLPCVSLITFLSTKVTIAPAITYFCNNISLTTRFLPTHT